MTKTLCELLREAGGKDTCVARNWGEEGEDYGGVCLDAAEEIERLQREVLELKAALFFWIPGVPALDPEIAERAGHDSFLLIDAECGMQSAQDLGWISLRRPPDEPPAPTA